MLLHITRAEFSTQLVQLDPRYVQSALHHGFHVPIQVDSLTAHVAKHIWAQEQWLVTTTAETYLEDVRNAVLAPNTRLAVYLRARRPMVTCLATTADVVPIDRTGPGTGTYLLVVYSPDNAMIVTAYMVSSVLRENIPAGAQWLT